MRNWLMDIPVRIGLTGTPVGNHLLDLFGEMFAVAGIAVFGSSFGRFQSQYFAAVDPKGWKWIPRRGTKEKLRDEIQPYAFSISQKDMPPVPQVLTNPIQVVLPENIKAMQKVLVRELAVKLNEGVTLEVMSASALATKLRQFASGAVYTESEAWEELHAAKLDALEELLDEQQGDPVLLFYHYKHERDRILERFPQAKTLERIRGVAEWNDGETELLVCHPQSAGFGLNLQLGGSTICWFTLPWSVELWEQAVGRLARQGQPEPIVTNNVLLAGPADEMVLHALRNKGKVQQEILEALEM